MLYLPWLQGTWKSLRTAHMEQSDSVLLSWLTSVVCLPLPLTGDDEGPADPPLLEMGRSIQWFIVKKSNSNGNLGQT